MRLILLLALLVSPVASAQPAVKPNLIDSDTPFTPDGKIEIIGTMSLSGGEASKVESGVLNGVSYRFYYSDGSGIFPGREGNTGKYTEPMDGNWSVACKKDPMSDQKHCYMHIRDLWVFVFPNGKALLSIGSEHFPGSVVAIRMDSGAPTLTSPKDEGVFSQEAAAKIVQQLKAAKTVTTRYMKWPYKTWVDQTWNLYAFSEAYQYITWAVERIK